MLSVIVPVYNGAHILPVTIPAMLAQREPAAWLFVDDGSTDNTAATLAELTAQGPVAEGATVRLLAHDTNRGRAAARNTGLEAAEGEAIVFLDADVAPASGYLAALRTALDRPGAVAAVARLVMAGADASDAYHRYLASERRGARSSAPEAPIPWRYFLSGIAAIRAEALQAVGGFDPSYSYGEDLELGARLAARFPDGLRFALDAEAHLYDLGTLDTALANMREFGGANLPRMLAAHPDLAEQVGVHLLCSDAGWTGRLARLTLRPSLARLARRALPFLPRGLSDYAVRYLLGYTVATTYRAATRTS